MTPVAKRWLWGLLGGALLLRLLGILWGLPQTYNADEPHLVNLAVSFGGGSPRPYAFKYPTLWPYVLFLSYGVYFLIWSAAGLRHGLGEFAGAFGWHPAPFYLIGRLLSCAASLGAVAAVAAIERREARKIPWGAMLLALSPAVVEAARSLKPDSAALLLCALGTLAALRVLDAEGPAARRWHHLCGLSLGLASSCQFTALPALVLLPAAHFCARKRAKLAWLAEGAAAGALGFSLGTPYALLDWPRFKEWLGVLGGAASGATGSWSRAQGLSAAARAFWDLGGPGSVAGLAVLAGLWRLLREDRRKALVLSAPIVACLLAFSKPSYFFARFLFGAFPAAALLAGAGASLAERARRPRLTALLAALLLVPGAVRSTLEGYRRTLPDTRRQAGGWIAASIPAGATILTDQPSAGPDLRMSKDQLLELAERSRVVGSPRAKLFEAMAQTHPGGGYRVLRILRSGRDLGTYAKHAELSQADAPTADVRPGLDVARALRVDYVLTSSYGADLARAPELAAFFTELETKAPLAAVFSPVPGVVAGPALRLYRLK